MLRSGLIINGIYKVIEPIGEGGAGEVFLAWHNNLQKKVVIKRIKDNFLGKINERGEADILKRLHHRYIPQVYDYIQIGREVYTIIDYIDGNPLSDYIEKRVRFNELQIIKWLKQLCEALDYLHTQDPPIIHSDIKPSNIMVDQNGDICLIDFNISFDESDTEKISGYTEGYASPEQILKAQMYTTGGNYKNIRLDSKSDIFSLGASIYHIMTLENPVKMYKEDWLWDIPLPMPYSEILIGIVEKSIKREAAERYQTAGEMLRDLETIKIRDTRYRRLYRTQMIYNGTALLLVIAGIIMTVKGISLRNEESFDEEYKRIVDESYEDDYDRSIKAAMELLNDRKYNRVFDKRKEEEANLLFVIANAYFETDDYESAIQYYGQAIGSYDGNSEYYRDYAIAYARLKKLDDATAVLKEGIDKGMTDPDLYLVNAEIENARGELERAIADYERVIQTARVGNTLGRAYILCARAYKADGDMISARNMLEEAENVVDDKWRIRVIREKGSICIRYIEDNGADPDWLEEADDCYKSLINSGKSTLNDWLNYSLIKRLLGEEDMAVSILEQAQEYYPDEYIIPLRHAVFEIESQAKLPDKQRDYSKAKEYYEKADELYRKAENSGDSSDEMQRLRELIQDLYSKGWL